MCFVVFVVVGAVVPTFAQARARTHARTHATHARTHAQRTQHTQRTHARNARNARTQHTQRTHARDAVDGERGLGDVGGEHHLASALRGGLEDLGLPLGGQGGVDGADDQLADFGAKRLGACVVFLFGSRACVF